MSVVTKLSNAAYCGYSIGQAVAHRRNWMDRARDMKTRFNDAQHTAYCVRSAREQSREVVRQLRRLKQVSA